MKQFVSAETHGPLVVMNGTPSYSATPVSFVLSFGAHASNIFFFGTSVSTGSPSNPTKLTRSPFTAPTGGTTKSTKEWSSFDAHITIPWLISSRNGPGFTLQSTKTRAPIICSPVLNARSPDTTCRSLDSPTSIVSTHSLSAPGCSHALVMVPTRMSSTSTVTSFLAMGSFLGLSFFSNSFAAFLAARAAAMASSSGLAASPPLAASLPASPFAAPFPLASPWASPLVSMSLPPVPPWLAGPALSFSFLSSVGGFRSNSSPRANGTTPKTRFPFC
mmetsp:Transcript_8635/g.32331  ORF Transcript_8635/g.32331 Transcript_8635/m.32331 type:complete len:275 (-) Transcript_8635:548-1372(-)